MGSASSFAVRLRVLATHRGHVIVQLIIPEKYTTDIFQNTNEHLPATAARSTLKSGDMLLPLRSWVSFFSVSYLNEADESHSSRKKDMITSRNRQLKRSLLPLKSNPSPVKISVDTTVTAYMMSTEYRDNIALRYSLSAKRIRRATSGLFCLFFSLSNVRIYVQAYTDTTVLKSSCSVNLANIQSKSVKNTTKTLKHQTQLIQWIH